MADLQGQLQKSKDQISNYKRMFREVMLKWKDKPKLKKYRDWSKKMYDKVNEKDDFDDETLINDIVRHTAVHNSETDFQSEDEDFNIISTILKNLWKWLKKKKKIMDAIEKLSSARCGKPRVGHGAEGLPCKCFLGEDNTCRYHGPASAVA